VPWHKPYTHDGGHVLCHGTNSIPRWNLYLFHLCQIVPKSGSTRPWKIQREATHRYLRCNCDSPESDECVRPHGLYVRGVYRQLQRCINSSISRFSSFQMRPTRVSLLQVFLFPSFFLPKEQVLFCLSCEGWMITQTLGLRVQEILPSLETLTNESEPTLDLPRRLSRQGKSPWLSTE